MTEIPTVDGSDMTPAQRKAYIIADNKIALNAGWDYEMLNLEFDELKEQGFDLDLLAFSNSELGFLNEDEDNTSVDDVDMGEAYEIIVECIGELEQRTLLEKLTAEGYKCKSLMR
jgi:ParB-like chromosome segregation protein Spo0J